MRGRLTQGEMDCVEYPGATHQLIAGVLDDLPYCCDLSSSQQLFVEEIERMAPEVSFECHRLGSKQSRDTSTETRNLEPTIS